MKVLVIGDFPERSRQLAARSFPTDWELCFAAPEDAERFLNDAEVVIPEHITVDDRFLENAPWLRLVQTGAGYDNVDINACTGRGVWVCNAAGINAGAVAEHVMAFILCWYKNIVSLDGYMKGKNSGGELDYSGSEIAGKTIGIIGLGAIGSRVAEYSRAFGMRVLGYARSPKELPGVELVSLDTLYAKSDIVTVHVPLNASTRHMLGREAFDKMKKDALLINTARGAVVDQAQLVEALKDHSIGGACLDVFEEEPLPLDSPLRAMPNVILTPHTAGLPDGVKYHRARYEFFRENILKVLNGLTPDNNLNMPQQ